MEQADLQELLETFSADVFFKGLYTEAKESDRKTLTCNSEGIYIGTLWMCGRIMVTISMGEVLQPNYRQFTAMASCDNPLDVFVKSYDGNYYELMSMVQTVAKMFRSRSPVMHHDTLIYAGVRIG